MSNDNVVTLSGVSVAAANEAVVSELEYLLDKARDGAIDGFAYSASNADGSSSIGRRGLTSHAVIGGLACIQHHLLGEMAQ